jgi:demethylmenaquinone methyltransferase / 2-methoxy-6-polyprenyl-1,4-benzoquinol methylase
MASDRAAAVDGAALSGRDREAYVARLFDKIAGPYDRLNRLISLGRDKSWRRLAIEMAGVVPGANVLDLGCGTGDFILAALPALAGRGSVIGLDLAPNMLEVARAKIEPVSAGAAVELRCGNAAATGVPDGWADVITMGWVVRNLGDRPASYSEMLRVLKPGGRFVSLDSSKPASAFMRAGFAAYLRGVMPLVVRLCGGDRDAYRYLADSTDRFLTARELADELRAAGFADVSFRSLMGGAMAIHRAVR